MKTNLKLVNKNMKFLIFQSGKNFLCFVFFLDKYLLLKIIFINF